MSKLQFRTSPLYNLYKHIFDPRQHYASIPMHTYATHTHLVRLHPYNQNTRAYHAKQNTPYDFHVILTENKPMIFLITKQSISLIHAHHDQPIILTQNHIKPSHSLR